MIEYRGYTGVFEYDPEIDSFFGHVVDIRGAITFYGKSLEELKREMATSVDEYLAFCEERGVEPAKPYSGRFNVRMEPELHRTVANAAAAEGKSMNEWAVEKLAKAAESAPRPRRIRTRAKRG
jgi:predicted HicB family RNase H-like nuclease